MFIQVVNVVLLFTLFMYYVDESFTSDSLEHCYRKINKDFFNSYVDYNIQCMFNPRFGMLCSNTYLFIHRKCVLKNNGKHLKL